MRVLLIEDDPDLGAGIRSSLREEGYTLDWLKDGESAVHALREEGFDLVVLDLGLPRLDGIQVLRQSRANGLTTPVLILTARDDTEDRVAGLDAVQARQAEVEHHQVETFLAQGMDGTFAVLEPVQGVALFAEAGANARAEVGIVFNEQDAHGLLVSSAAGRLP